MPTIFSRLGIAGIFRILKFLPPVLAFEHKTGYARAVIYHFRGKLIALEFQGTTTVGKIPVPGNIVVFAFVTVDHIRRESLAAQLSVTLNKLGLQCPLKVLHNILSCFYTNRYTD